MIYEYECKVHGVFENVQSSFVSIEHCPQCVKEGLKSDPPKRLISVSSFVLVGGGWAKDHYSKK